METPIENNPTIDLSPLLNGSDEDIQNVAQVYNIFFTLLWFSNFFLIAISQYGSHWILLRC